MAEQKKTNEALNVEDALTQSEAFFIKNKKAIIGAVVAVIIIIAGVVMYKNLYADPREEKAYVLVKLYSKDSQSQWMYPQMGYSLPLPLPLKN